MLSKVIELIFVFVSCFLIFMFANVFVYGKLRVCVRGFSEGKSDVAIMQRPFDLALNRNYFYTLLATGFFIRLLIQ